MDKNYLKSLRTSIIIISILEGIGMTENRFPICRAVLVSHKTYTVIARSLFPSSSELICLLQERLTRLERRGSLVSLCVCVQYLHFPRFIRALRTFRETGIILIRSTGPALLLLWHYL